MKVFVAQLNPIVGDLHGNADKIINSLKRAKKEEAQIVLFSEMVLTGYPPEDLLLFPSFVQDAEKELLRIVKETDGLFAVIGAIRKNLEGKEKQLFNTAVIMIDGNIVGYKDKTLLPTYDVFYERRYFEPGKKQKVWKYKGKKVAVLICEDVWKHGDNVIYTSYRRDPVIEIQKLKPDLLLVPSASPYYYGKKKIRAELYLQVAKTLKIPTIVCNQVGGNDQLVFDGYSIFSDKGELNIESQGFQEDFFLVDLDKKYKKIKVKEDNIEDLYNALVLGVKDYFQKLGYSKACLGVSGGIDSALVAVIAADALGAKNILALSMPSKFSSKGGIEDSRKLTKNLSIELLTISIEELFEHFLKILGPIFKDKSSKDEACKDMSFEVASSKDRDFGIAEENLQARIRGMLLMAISNKFGHIVLSTSNKSEMAMGYSTLYGDMCGGLGVLVDVSKAEVYKLAKWINRKSEIIPTKILKKAPSAELRPNQKDTDALPPYPVVDAVLKDYVEEHFSLHEIVKRRKVSQNIVRNLIDKIHLAEYKRRQAPPGICTTKRAFTKGRFLPIVQKWR